MKKHTKTAFILNSFCAIGGLLLLPITWQEFFGYYLIIEGFFMTIECAGQRTGTLFSKDQ